MSLQKTLCNVLKNFRKKRIDSICNDMIKNRTTGCHLETHLINDLFSEFRNEMANILKTHSLKESYNILDYSFSYNNYNCMIITEEKLDKIDVYPKKIKSQIRSLCDVILKNKFLNKHHKVELCVVFSPIFIEWRDYYNTYKKDIQQFNNISHILFNPICYFSDIYCKILENNNWDNIIQIIDFLKSIRNKYIGINRNIEPIKSIQLTGYTKISTKSYKVLVNGKKEYNTSIDQDIKNAYNYFYACLPARIYTQMINTPDYNAYNNYIHVNAYRISNIGNNLTPLNIQLLRHMDYFCEESKKILRIIYNSLLDNNFNFENCDNFEVLHIIFDKILIPIYHKWIKDKILYKNDIDELNKLTSTYSFNFNDAQNYPQYICKFNILFEKRDLKVKEIITLLKSK
jgi:hypothetical protein